MPFPDDQNLCSLAGLKAWLDTPPAGGISSVSVTAGGSGYTSATVSIVDASGKGATATATISGGVIVAIVVANAGRDYAAPSVVIVGDGSGATATAAIGADVALSALINRASATILLAANYDVLYDSGHDIVEKRSGNGRNRIIPRVLPVVSVSGVSVGTTTFTASDGTITGYLSDPDWNYIELLGGSFARGQQNVTLTYRGGIQAGSIVAYAAEQACLWLCASEWKKRPHIGHVSESNKDGGTTAYSQVYLPNEAKQFINQIRRVAPMLA